MTTDPKKRLRYSLAELMAQCEPEGPAYPIWEEWDRLEPVGLERLPEDNGGPKDGKKDEERDAD